MMLLLGCGGEKKPRHNFLKECFLIKENCALIWYRNCSRSSSHSKKNTVGVSVNIHWTSCTIPIL